MKNMALPGYHSIYWPIWKPHRRPVPTAIMKSSRSKTPAGYWGWGRSHYKDMYPRSEKLVNDHLNSQSCRMMFTYFVLRTPHIIY